MRADIVVIYTAVARKNRKHDYGILTLMCPKGDGVVEQIVCKTADEAREKICELVGLQWQATICKLVNAVILDGPKGILEARRLSTQIEFPIGGQA